MYCFFLDGFFSLIVNSFLYLEIYIDDLVYLGWWNKFLDFIGMGLLKILLEVFYIF